MTYRIVHRTTYKYRYPVSLGNHVACLKPRSGPRHRLAQSELHILPLPATITERVDYFGNTLSFFTVQEPHKELVVEARSEIIMNPDAANLLRQSLPWEEAVRWLAEDRSAEGIDACQFRFESPRIRLRPELAEYARGAFTPERPLHEGLLGLTALIHRDFQFDSRVTNVRTPTEEVFKRRRGVCQDFAHLQIACLRSLGLPARYVSGYLRTYPPPGQPRLVGADASHAWVSAYCPNLGWLDLDPTNNLIPSNGHVTLAWGRDYSDVSPLRGLILGGGVHSLSVGVDMEIVEN
jgi:transglutaminase-like putative cysteine protease